MRSCNQSENRLGFSMYRSYSMNHSKHEKGQALILIVLAIFGLIGLTGLTIDGGNAYSDRRHAQNAADAAVMAAALTKVRGGDWHAAGMARAADNSYDNNGTSNIVQVVSPPISGVYAGNPDYIQVLIESHVDTYFAKVVAIFQMTNRVQAIAKTKLSEIGPLFDGQALVALKPDGTTFTTCGNPNVNIDLSGIFVNSSSDCAMDVQGNVDMSVDTGYAIVNATSPVCTNGTVNMEGPISGGAEQVDYPPRVDLAAPSEIDCGKLSAGSYDKATNTFSPGIYNSIKITNGTQHFAPGEYCINGDVAISGGSVDINFAQFQLNAGEFLVKGNADFGAYHTVFSAPEDGTFTGFHFNGTGDITVEESTFYLGSGGLELNGDADNTFTAPTDPNAPNNGMLIYMPYGNTSNLVINGNADSTFTGTILGVSAPITVYGNSNSEAISSQIIGYTVEVCGNSDLNMSFDPGVNFQQLEPAKMGLIE